MRELNGIHSCDSRALNAGSSTPRLSLGLLHLMSGLCLMSLRPTLRLLGPQAGLLTCYVSVVYR